MTLAAQAERWLEVTANARVHGRTGIVPRTRFEQERAVLLPLAPRPYCAVVPLSPARPLRVESTRRTRPLLTVALDEILRQLDGGAFAAPATLEALPGAQISLRNNRRLQAAMRSSRLPAVKTSDRPASGKRTWPSAWRSPQPRAVAASTTARSPT